MPSGRGAPEQLELIFERFRQGYEGISDEHGARLWAWPRRPLAELMGP